MSYLHVQQSGRLKKLAHCNTTIYKQIVIFMAVLILYASKLVGIKDEPKYKKCDVHLARLLGTTH